MQSLFHIISAVRPMHCRIRHSSVCFDVLIKYRVLN